MSGLAPPSEAVEDPGAHELHDSSDDHFSDASEGARRSMASDGSHVPITRVERVDDSPAHGEVPGTAAYKLRTQDAVPDEIEVVPDGQRSRSSSRLREEDRPHTPGGTVIPRTIVEKVEPSSPSHGEVPGTAAYDMRRADAQPDEILTSPPEARQSLAGEPTSMDRSDASLHDESIEARESLDRTEFEDVREGGNAAVAEPASEEYEAADESFGDDFDDFEEGGGEDDDFGDFGQVAEEEAAAVSQVEPPQSFEYRDPLSHLPNVDLTSPDAMHSTTMPYLEELFPDADFTSMHNASSKSSAEALLSDRSASLWSQLVAPPPLQPPNWIRSRIRRLFLVSLGVPVDLDEILPASKQKKLILPSIHLNTDSPRESSSLLRVKKENASSTSVSSALSPASESGKKERKKKSSDRPGPPPPPQFDSNGASLLCSTTDIAMQNFADDELKAHVERLKLLSNDADQVLQYWIKRKESAVGDKEAFEGVIENLVGYAKKSKSKR